MSTPTEMTGTASRRARRFRADLAEPGRLADLAATWMPALLVAALFTLLGGAREPGDAEGRLGLAIGAGVGPLGQVFGGWDPAIWPLPVALGQLWGWFEQHGPSSAAIRWPSALAGLGIGLLLARRAREAMGGPAAFLVALSACGSLALMDGSSRIEGELLAMMTGLARWAGLPMSPARPVGGIDLLSGLAIVAALDRILAGKADRIAGAWAAAAFLSGGWPPLAVIGLAAVPAGKHADVLTPRFLLPVAATFAGWTAWAWSAASAEAWAAALFLPLTGRSAWWLVPGVLALAMPWTPFAALAAWPSIREGWTPSGRSMVVGWLQVAGACLVVGTVVPGLATAARVPALAGLAVAAAAGLEGAWAGGQGFARRGRRALLGLTLALGLAWAAVATSGGVYLALAVSYYRGVAIVLAILGMVAAALAVGAAWNGRPRTALAATIALAVGLKLAHAGYYAPEWNYRFGQGPWGRAIGQWVPPRFPIYTTHAWRADLAFATGRQFRQIRDPRLLESQGGPMPRFVLLHPAELEHWPADALKLVKVRSFQDEFGGERVLARTDGPFSWRQAAIDSRDME